MAYLSMVVGPCLPYYNQLWKFPSLAKEGWRAAPGWFEMVIPSINPPCGESHCCL